MKTSVLSTFQLLIFGFIVVTFASCSKASAPSEGPAKPVITSIFPDSGHFGTVVTITGKNFNPVPASNIVTIDGVQALVNEATDTSIKIIVPVTGTGVIAVKTDDLAIGPVFNYTYDILIAGKQTKYGGGYYSSAICWVNGIPIALTNATSNASANAVATSGYDVYVVGYEYTGGISIAKVWKNKIPQTLNDGTYSASANAITIVGKDVYIAGYESDGDKKIATVWKNGVATRMTPGEASAIIVSGNDIYVAGHEVVGWSTSIAKLWKNGIETALNDSSGYNFVTSMALSGNDVYEVGYGLGFNSTEYEAKVWKNGLLQPAIQSSFRAFLYGIAIDGNDIYYAGFSPNMYTDQANATLWKNNARVWVTAANVQSQFNAITIKDNDIYLASQEYIGSWITKLYKNKVDSTYTDNTTESVPKSILVR